LLFGVKLNVLIVEAAYVWAYIFGYFNFSGVRLRILALQSILLGEASFYCSLRLSYAV
jgi:hypothetical protein